MSTSQKSNSILKYAPIILVVVVLIFSVISLLYSIKISKDIDDIEKEVGMSPGEHFSNQSTHHAVDGVDYAHLTTTGHSQHHQIECPPTSIPEPHSGSVPHASGQPTYKYQSSHYSDNYPDETDPHNLQGKGTYGCSPDHHTGPGDYQLNVQNLLPGSWREGADCDADHDKSQWHAYAPKPEAFANAVQTAGSARLSQNTRSSHARITGLRNPLRSSAVLPLHHHEVSPFNGSSLRDDILHDATGYYPASSHC